MTIIGVMAFEKPECEKEYVVKSLEIVDSINNTYACIRRVNGGSPRASSLDSSKLSSMNGLGENFLYCKFSGNPTFEEYYDIDEDPWQLKNAMDTLDVEQRVYLRQKLKKFVACSGTDSCR